MDFWENFWGLLWSTLWIYLFLSFLGALFWVMRDLFRDTTLNGWFKALWIVGLIFLPFLCLLAYLIARGNGMAERSQQHAEVRQEAQAAHIRSVAGVSVSEEITKARAMLDAGTITASEYTLIKERALAG
jgi:hypothetical protein